MANIRLLFSLLVLMVICILKPCDAQRAPLVCNRPNEVYACGSACQTTCATLGKACPIINIRCNDDCYCIDGYARDAQGKCIPIKQCG